MSRATSHHTKEPQVSSSTVKCFAMALKEARKTNRQVVPIVGAGLSADCGFPIVTAIVRYFGKLQQYIAEQIPLPTHKSQSDDKISYPDELFVEYKKNPWKFVEDFGWPDRFQLNQDLYLYLSDSKKKPRERLVENAVRAGLDAVLDDVNRVGSWEYKDLSKDIKKKLTVIEKNLVNPEAKAALSAVRKRLEENRSRSAAFDIVGDWRRLILTFTNFHSDYADALFARFGSSRQPGQGHRFLAFLAQCLAVPTVFTFNFDSLIEQSLEAEGIRPRVFAMEHGAGLPHAQLVKDQLSLIKMHGSTHALLLDEQLDRPLRDGYLQRFIGLTKKDPLLFVVGCSDGDRRLRDLVTYVVEQSSADIPSVLWLHYESEVPRFLKELMENPRAPNKILTCQTNNPGATLQHLYSWLTNSTPAGQTPYLAHVQQPVDLASTTFNGKKRSTSRPKWTRFELVSSLTLNTVIPSASYELLKRANYWSRHGYQFIWVDLEAVHTFAGVVGSIIDQCRKYDPDLAPSVLPFDIDSLPSEGTQQRFLNTTLELAATRVARALRRTRYYLAIDGLETYVWPATTHHGLSHIAIQSGAGVRLKNLVDFLEKLRGEELGESIVGISVDESISRHHNRKLNKYIRLRALVNEFDKRPADSNPFLKNHHEFKFKKYFKYLADDLPLISLQSIPDGFLTGTEASQRNERLALIFLHLSCFRRMRPLVVLRYLIKPLLGSVANQGDDDAVEQNLKPLIDLWNGQVLQQLEGGGYWFARAIRNEVYTENTRYTDTENIGKCLSNKTPAEVRTQLCSKTAFQLYLAAMTHQRISQTWYTRTFVQSDDSFAFLEYTYHRISSIRYLAKLRRLVQVACTRKIIAEAVVAGILKGKTLEQLITTSEQPEFESQFSGRLTDSQGEPVNYLKELESNLAKHHSEELGSLYRAWTRAEVTLRTQVPAEQLLYWCDELLTDDLIHRCNRVVTDYVKKSGPRGRPQFELIHHRFPSKGVDDEFVDKALEDGVIKEFRHYLQDLQAKLWIERSDYKTSIPAIWRHLLNSADKNPRKKVVANPEITPITAYEAKKLEKDDRFISSCDVAQCHRLLDIVNCRFQLQQESSFTDHELMEKRKAPRDLLNKIRKQLEKLEATSARKQEQRETNKIAAPAEKNKLNEAWLRLLHLQAENHMGRITVFTHDGFTAATKNWKPKVAELEEVTKTISEALERIRMHDARTDRAPRSVVLDPTTDGSLYLQYRAICYMLKGRTEWLKNSEEGFQKAQLSFEIARGGLHDHSPLLSALIELYTVEALLGQARKVLFSAPSDEKAEEAFKTARGLYDSARGGLQRAREWLLASRRNVVWRKFFFRLTTQYHSDRLLLGYARVRTMVGKLKARDNKERNGLDFECEKVLREYLLRLRRAYLGLLSAVDLYLPHASDQTVKNSPCPGRFRWIYRMWWELTLCAYATGRIALTLDSKSNAIRDHGYMIAQLQWLNKTGGIKASQLGKWVNEKYKSLETNYDKVRTGDDGAMAALVQRQNLIKRAMQAAGRRAGRNVIESAS